MPITLDSDLEQLQCPMTLEIMNDPVIAEDGYTYERSAITRWINENGTSPMTRMRMQASELRPNRAIKALIDTYHTQTQRFATQEPQNIAVTPPIEQENLAVIQDILHEDSFQVNLSYENRNISSSRYDQLYNTRRPYNSSNFRRSECDSTETDEYGMGDQRDSEPISFSLNRFNNRRQFYGSDGSINHPRSSRYRRNRHEYDYSHTRFTTDRNRFNLSHVNYNESVDNRFSVNRSNYRNPYTNNTQPIVTSNNISVNRSASNRNTHSTHDIYPANSNDNNQSSRNERTTRCTCITDHKRGCCIFICVLIIASGIAVPIIMTSLPKRDDASTIVTTNPTTTTTKAPTTAQARSFAFRCDYDLQIILLTLLCFYRSIKRMTK